MSRNINTLVHQRALDRLEKDEEKRKKPYVDTVGKITIGIGRNLTDRGLSELEIQYLFNNDLAIVQAELKRNIPFTDDLDYARYMVLVNMCFNLGITKLLGFKNFLRLLAEKQWKLAAKEMLNSKWATQVKKRSKRLSRVIETGIWPADFGEDE